MSIQRAAGWQTMSESSTKNNDKSLKIGLTKHFDNDDARECRSQALEVFF
jgi:hypothetical protein